MKRWFQWLAVFVLFELSAYPCGPDFPTAIFVTTDHPGGDYAVFAKGHIGIPQKNYRTRDLVLIYNDLTGRELTDEEQEQAVKVQDHYMETWRETNQEQKSAPTALDRWLAARSGFGTLEKIDNSLDTVDYESVTNCLDGAFTNAAATLAARIKAYGRSNPAVIEWVRGQDAVFAQCDQGRPRFFFGPGKPPPPPAPPQPPAAVPASAPVWLQQDRAYQLAAAHFYATDYTAAIADFRAIAADAASPWSSTARYLIARCLIRKATLIDSRYSTAAGGDSAKEQAAANARMIAGLKLAQAELVAMQAEPRMATMQHAM